jgi:ribonuclease-3
LVRTDQLAIFGEQLNIGSAIRLGRGEAYGGGRNRPALLCAAFEALIGAIYLQGNISAVQDFLEPRLKEAVAAMVNELDARDPKSRLQEWAQSLGYGPPIYRTVGEYGPDHAKVFEIEVWVADERQGKGRGTSKSAAAKRAAQAALDKLNTQ